MAQNFLADVRFGKVAEDIFANELKYQGHLIVQATGNWKWWDIYDMTDDITYEIKRDTWIKKTGNLCIELFSHKKHGQIGWVFYSKSDYLIYFMSDAEYLKIPMKEIREYVQNPDNLKGKRKVSGWSRGNSEVQNVLVPYEIFTKKINTIKRKTIQQGVCVICGKIFTPQKKNGRYITCSNECAKSRMSQVAKEWNRKIYNKDKINKNKERQERKAKQLLNETDIQKEARLNKERERGFRRRVSQREGRLWRTYKITTEEYEAMLKKQNNQCAICNKTIDKNLCIDHDHKSGIIRGLLCGKCNQGIGLLNEDISTFKRAIRYLKKYEGK